MLRTCRKSSKRCITLKKGGEVVDGKAGEDGKTHDQNWIMAIRAEEGEKASVHGHFAQDDKSWSEKDCYFQRT